MSVIIEIKPGASISCKGRRFCITKILDLETVLATDEVTGVPEMLFVKDLVSADALQNEADGSEDDGVCEGTELTSVDKNDWEEANRRYLLILPLIECSRRTRRMVEKQAKTGGVHVMTLYRWMNIFLSTGQVSALLPNKRGVKKGQSRLPVEVVVIVRTTIEDFYKKSQKHKATTICEEVEKRCRNAGLLVPHPNTVRKFIAEITEELKISRRTGRRAMKQAFDPVRGRFPGADFPLAYVQIDHTLLDIILVDEETRRVIGRAWLTIAIDVFSRMVCGFYVSLDPPGAHSAGLAIAHAILPKEKWLEQHGIETSWSVWGLPRTIHADNAREFRGKMLKRACQEYGIDTNFRPVATPHYGGHIERFLGTVATEIHALPGTTFSKPSDKGDYDSEAHAMFTLKELETWLATFFVEVYHQRGHSALGMSPAQKFMEGILGTKDRPGTGFPKRIADETKLRLDFMPYFERTVQRYGVQIDKVEYYHDVLRPFINAIDPADPKRKAKRKFIFRRDPRNVSRIYFYDPDRKRYSPIPYRNLAHPAASIWELRAAIRQLETEGRKSIDENGIFAAIRKMRLQQENAAKETKHTRRSKERRRFHSTGAAPLISTESSVDSHHEGEPSSRADIKPFEEIEKVS